MFNIVRLILFSSQTMKDQITYKEFKSAAVVCNNFTSCNVGKDILKEGGSVVDAAIASMLALGVVSFQSAGIGGGFLMVHYDAQTGKDYCIDARSRAPIDVENLKNDTDQDSFKYGKSAICVPGEVWGYWEAHQRFGRLRWAKLFQPAIFLAENGFQMTPICGDWIRRVIPRMDDNKAIRKLLSHPDGSFKKVGDIVINKKYAETLRAIAKEGADVFYKGSLQQSILEDIHAGFGKPSSITARDLELYKGTLNESIRMNIDDDLTLITLGAPSGGPILVYLLNILKGYGFTLKNLEIDKMLTYHRIIEAMKFAFAKRAQLGDPNFIPGFDKMIQEMTSDKFCERVRSKIDDTQTHSAEYYEQNVEQTPDDPGTAHISIVGTDGSAVSMTSTINHAFGSQVLGEKTGIVFNNQMTAFSLQREVGNRYYSNRIEPRKRALSSTTPALILKKTSQRPEVKLVLGGAGSKHIITATAQVIMQIFWFGKNLNNAVKSKRVHHQWLPNILNLEENTDEELVEEMRKRGHKIVMFPKETSNIQAIMRLDD